MSDAGMASQVTRRKIARGDVELDVEEASDASLLDVARRHLGLVAATRGCRDGSCGACRLLVDGDLVNACLVPWCSIADGARVEGYEDLASDPAAQRVVDAFAAERPTRCRQCTPALAVTAVDLTRRGCAGDSSAIEGALVSATCACTGRGSWRRALAVL